MPAAIAELWTAAYVTEGERRAELPRTRRATSSRRTATGAARPSPSKRRRVVGVVALAAPGAPGRAVAQAEEAELSRLVVSASARGPGIGPGAGAVTATAGQDGRVERDRALEPPLPGGRPPPLRIARLQARARARREPTRAATSGCVFRLGSTPIGALARMAAVENLTKRLEGSIVMLEPFGEEHVEGLWEAAQARRDLDLARQSDERETFDLWIELTPKPRRRAGRAPSSPATSAAAASSAAAATSMSAPPTGWSRSAGPGSTRAPGAAAPTSRPSC